MVHRKQTFRLTKSGDIVLKPSPEAIAAKNESQEAAKQGVPPPPVLSPEQVCRNAKQLLLTVDKDADINDQTTLLSNYAIQRYQYRGKTFCWLLEHDPAYVSYLIRDQKKPGSGRNDNENNWISNVQQLGIYARKFPQFLKLHGILSQQTRALSTGNTGEVKIGFGKFRGMTFHELATSQTRKHVRYIDEFLLPKKNIQSGSAMDRLRKYIIEHRASQSLSRESSVATPTHSEPVVPDPKVCISASTETVAASHPIPLSTPSLPIACVDQDKPVAVVVPEETWRKKWNCSPYQAAWMESELKELGLFPGTISYNQQHCWEGKALLRHPPSPELQKRNPSALPEPAPFYLHPMFVWAPETVCRSLCPSLPCINKGCPGKAKRRGLGRPRVVVAAAGQYYIFATELMCDTCDTRPWSSDSPKFLQRLPDCLRNILPAKMAYNKAVDIGLVDRIRRSGRSPADVANEVNELAAQKFERRHLQYMLLLQSVRELARRGRNLDSFLGFDVDAPSIDFGDFSDVNGHCGVTVSSEFITTCLVEDYEEQQPTINCLLKGTFGSCLRSDHTRSLAKKVEAHSGAMWSYTIMNEFWEVICWVMVESESESTLESCYAGLGRRYSFAQVEKPKFRWVDKWCCITPPTSTGTSSVGNVDKWDDVASAAPAGQVDRSRMTRKSACRQFFNSEIGEFLDAFHCIRRIGRCCSSEAHPGYPKFMAMLSNAFFIIDNGDLQALRTARASLGWSQEASKNEIRRHCRMQIPEPNILEKRVTAVMLAFCNVKDNKNLPLFTNQMLHEWSLQREHIRRGCLSDPLEAGGVLYRFTGYVHLGHKKSPETKLATWQSLRGSSQLEGLHPHQVGWVTGARVGAKLFQAQAMFGVVKWNMKRSAEHRKLKIPSVFNPLLAAKINTVSSMEYGSPKYPDFILNDADTKESFGVDYCLSNQQQALDAVFEDDREPALEAESATLDFQQEIIGLLQRIPASDVTPLHHTDVAMISPDLDGPITTTETEQPGAIPSSRVAVSTSTITSEVASKRKLVECSEVVTSKQKPSETRRMTFGGVLTPWSPDRWTCEMKDIINQLLASTKPPNRYKKITANYNKIVLDRADEPHCALKTTNAHFIQLYDRQVSRKLEGRAATHATEEQATQMKELEQTFSAPATVVAHVVGPIPSRPPVIPKAPMIQIALLGQLPPIATATPSVSHTVPPTSNVPPQSKARKSRLCSYCKAPKSKLAGTLNLHHTYIRKGQPCFFYCPEMMSAQYGTPKKMSFAEFSKTEYFQSATVALLKKKEDIVQRKAAAEARRSEKGWRKPGKPS